MPISQDPGPSGDYPEAVNASSTAPRTPERGLAASPGRTRWCYAGMFVFLLVFFALTVRSGDDLGRLAKWHDVLAGPAGTYDLSQWSSWGLLTMYTNLNGRVIGNLLHLFLIDLWPLNVLVRAATALGLVWAIARVAGLRRLLPLPAILMLVLVPGLGMLTQAIIWSAGFFNYVPPVLLLLLLVLLRRRESRGIGTAVAAFGLALCASLFMETVTLFAVLGAAGLWLRGWIRSRRPGLFDSAMLLGFAAGAAIMFSAPGYRNVTSGQDLRRSVSGSGSLLSRMLEHGAEIGNGIASQLPLVLAVLAAAVTWLVLRGRSPQSGRDLAWRRALLGVMLGALGVLVLYGQLEPEAGGRTLKTLGLVSLLVAAAFFGAALLLLREHARAEGAAAGVGAAIASVVFAVALILPFFLVTPFTPRVLYPSAMLLVLAAVILGADRIDRARPQPALRAAVLAVPAAVLVGLLLPMSVNKAAEIRQLHQVAAAMAAGEHVIHVQQYPFPQLAKTGKIKERIGQLAKGVFCPTDSCVDYPLTVIVDKKPKR